MDRPRNRQMINKLRYDKTGFTLIEIIIVIIIVAILAMAALPMVMNYQKRAIATEAIVTLKTILTAEKTYYLEYDTYTMHWSGLNIKIRRRDPPPYDGALDGTYICQDNYFLSTDLGVSDMGNPPVVLGIICWLDYCTSCAPQAEKVRGWAVTTPERNEPYIGMDANGNIYSNIEGLGYPHDARFFNATGYGPQW